MNSPSRRDGSDFFAWCYAPMLASLRDAIRGLGCNRWCRYARHQSSASRNTVRGTLNHRLIAGIPPGWNHSHPVSPVDPVKNSSVRPKKQASEGGENAGASVDGGLPTDCEASSSACEFVMHVLAFCDPALHNKSIVFGMLYSDAFRRFPTWEGGNERQTNMLSTPTDFSRLWDSIKRVSYSVIVAVEQRRAR